VYREKGDFVLVLTRAEGEVNTNEYCIVLIYIIYIYIFQLHCAKNFEYTDHAKLHTAALLYSQASTMSTEDDSDPFAIFAQLNTEHNKNHQNDAVMYESSIGEACENEIEKY